MLVLYFIFLANIFCTSSFHGASFSNFFWAVLAFGRFSNKKFKYLYTFRSYAFAISIIVKQIALAIDRYDPWSWEFSDHLQHCRNSQSKWSETIWIFWTFADRDSKTYGRYRSFIFRWLTSMVRKVTKRDQKDKQEIMKKWSFVCLGTCYCAFTDDLILFLFGTSFCSHCTPP